jgi:site-specific DNA recombinase
MTMGKAPIQTPSPIARAALYLRVSTGRQAESDLSIPDQRRQLEAYCLNKNWSVAAEFVEPGNTATDDKRPAFQAMIDLATEKPSTVDVVLVHSFSRFFRDQFQFEFYVRKLARNGVRLVSITQELGDDPMSLMMRQIMSLFDEYQSRENAKHTLRAMKENARQGFWNGARPPLGYRIAVAEQRGQKLKKKLEIDPVEADKIRLIFRLAIHGEGGSGPMGVKSITAHLNSKAIRTRDGGTFGVSAVHLILGRTSYIGQHRFNCRSFKSGELKPESEHEIMEVPAIISREEFQAVQDALRARNKDFMSPRFVTSPVLLGGIAFCGQCGGAMTLRTGKGGAYRYYTCSTRARCGPTACEGFTVPMAQLDEAVVEHLETRLLEPERLANLMVNILDRRREWVERRRTHIAELRKRATDTDAKINRLYAAIEDGVADTSDTSLKVRIKELVKLRDDAQADVERAVAAMERLGPSITPELLEGFAAATRQALRNPDGGYRRDILRAVAQRVEVTGAKSLNICGSRIELLKTLASRGGVESAAIDVRSSVPVWRALLDSNQRPLA